MCCFKLWKQQTNQNHKDKKYRLVGFRFHNVYSTFRLKFNFISPTLSFPEMAPIVSSSHSYGHISFTKKKKKKVPTLMTIIVLRLIPKLRAWVQALYVQRTSFPNYSGLNNGF